MKKNYLYFATLSLFLLGHTVFAENVSIDIDTNESPYKGQAIKLVGGIARAGKEEPETFEVKIHSKVTDQANTEPEEFPSFDSNNITNILFQLYNDDDDQIQSELPPTLLASTFFEAQDLIFTSLSIKILQSEIVVTPIFNK